MLTIPDVASFWNTLSIAKHKNLQNKIIRKTENYVFTIGRKIIVPTYCYISNVSTLNERIEISNIVVAHFPCLWTHEHLSPTYPLPNLLTACFHPATLSQYFRMNYATVCLCSTETRSRSCDIHRTASGELCEYLVSQHIIRRHRQHIISGFDSKTA